MAQLTDQEVLDLIDIVFGQDEVYMWSTYILPNGRFLNPENNDDEDFIPDYEHEDFYLTIKGANTWNVLNKYCVKMNVTYPYIALPKERITYQQLNVIERILKYHTDEFILDEWDGLMILTHDSNERLYDFDELLDTRQVRKDMVRSYSAGFLESKKTHLQTDDKGRELSVEQIEYFKDSKVRDDKGNLLTVYHGTIAEFDIFDNTGESTELGYHFGTHTAATNRNPSKVMECYLNIENPLDAYYDVSIWDASGILDLLLTYNIVPDLTEIEYDFLSSLWNSCGGCDPDEDLEECAAERGLEVYNGLLDYGSGWFDTVWVNEYMPEIIEIITKRGYDGISYINAVEDVDSVSWIAFYPEQIKLVSNLTPTKSKSIKEYRQK